MAIDMSDNRLIAYCVSLLAAVLICLILCITYYNTQPQTSIRCPKCHEQFFYTLMQPEKQ